MMAAIGVRANALATLGTVHELKLRGHDGDAWA